MKNIMDYIDIKMVAIVKENNIFPLVLLFIWHGQLKWILLLEVITVHFNSCILHVVY